MHNEVFDGLKLPYLDILPSDMILGAPFYDTKNGSLSGPVLPGWLRYEVIILKWVWQTFFNSSLQNCIELELDDQIETIWSRLASSLCKNNQLQQQVL